MAEVLATTLPPAGWYRDPAARFDFRYWNGEMWTDHVQRDGVRGIDPDARSPSRTEAVATEVEEAEVEVEGPEVEVEAEEVPAPGQEPRAARSARWPVGVLAVVVGGAVLLAVGAVLPWAEAESTRASFSESGLDSLGAVTLLAAILVVLAIMLMAPSTRAAGCVAALGALALGVGVYEALDTSRKADDLLARSPAGVTAGVGVGVWVTIFAAAVVLIGGGVALGLDAADDAVAGPLFNAAPRACARCSASARARGCTERSRRPGVAPRSPTPTAARRRGPDSRCSRSALRSRTRRRAG